VREEFDDMRGSFQSVLNEQLSRSEFTEFANSISELQNSSSEISDCILRINKTVDRVSKVETRVSEVETKTVQLPTLVVRINALEFELKEELLPRLSDLQRSVHECSDVNIALSQDLKETQSLVDQEEKACTSIEQRLVKSLDAAFLHLQRSIQDEGNLRQASLSGMQSAISALRVDMEEDTAGRLQSAIYGMQSTRAELLVAHDLLEKNTQDFFRSVERFKMERISSEESIRKLILEEERARESQTIGIQESLKTIRHDLASEVRADLIDWKQLYHGLKKDVKDLMQEGLQVIVTKLSDQMEQIQVLLSQEISKCKRKSDAIEQRSTSKVHQLGEGSGEAPEEVMSHLPKPSLRALASPHFVFTAAAAGLSQEQCEMQPKFDLLEEVRVLTQKHFGKHQDLGWVSHSMKDAAH